jgi:hypothetical protein
LTIKEFKIIIIVIFLCQIPTIKTNAKATTSETLYTNIILEGNETRTIKNTILQIEGAITVTGNASLRLENVIIQFLESELRHGITVNNSASLVLIDTKIKIRITLDQNAYFTASNSQLINSNYCTLHETNHTTGGVTGKGNTSMTLDNCKIGTLWLHDNAHAIISDSNIHWTFSEGGKITINNSTIQAHREQILDQKVDLVIPEFTDYTGDLADVIPSSTSIFENVSLIEGLWLRVLNSSIRVDNSELFMIDSGGTSSVHLVNVTVSRINNHGGKFNLTVYDSAIEHLSSYNSDEDYFITGSILGTIDLSSRSLDFYLAYSSVDELLMDDVWFDPYISHVYHSSIRVFKPGLGNTEPNEFYMHNVTLLDGLGFRIGGNTPSGGLNLHGSMSFGEGYDLNETVVDGYANINRFYPVYCNSSSGPLANVSLTLLRGNVTLWEGETNSDGIGVVPVRFVHVFDVVIPYNGSGPTLIQANNMSEVVSLLWSFEESDGSFELGLTSETPILVEINGHDPLGKLLVPFLVVVFILVVVFKSE